MTHDTRAIVFLTLLMGVPTLSLAQEKPAPPRPWSERLTLSGDFRGRYEGFFQDARETRHRQRFRFRLSLTTEIHDDVTFGVRLASGEITDLTSTNQTFTDFLRRKAINIDQVYLTFTPAALPGVTIGGGKFGYPVRRTQLVWDDDINWEGTYQQYLWRPVEPTAIRLTAAQTPINEVSAGDDSMLLTWSADLSQQIGRHSFAVAATNYRFTHVDPIAIAVDGRGLSNPLRNRLTRDITTGRVTGFESEFRLVDVIAQATLATPRPDYPILLLVDWVKNTGAVSSEDTGVWVSAGYGRAARPRTWSTGYTFARIEEDAVLSTFNFSDIPPTNVTMHMINASYAPAARLNVDFTAILTRALRVSGPREPILRRVQADVRVSF